MDRGSYTCAIPEGFRAKGQIATILALNRFRVTPLAACRVNAWAQARKGVHPHC